MLIAHWTYGDVGMPQKKIGEVGRDVKALDVRDFPWFYTEPIEVKVKVLKMCKKHKFPIGTVRFFLCEENAVDL